MRGARTPLGRKTKERAAEVSGLQLSRVSPIPEAQAKSAGVAYCGNRDTLTGGGGVGCAMFVAASTCGTRTGARPHGYADVRHDRVGVRYVRQPQDGRAGAVLSERAGEAATNQNRLPLRPLALQRCGR
jgi:hypothetical protein